VIFLARKKYFSILDEFNMLKQDVLIGRGLSETFKCPRRMNKEVFVNFQEYSFI
jgi:hypothetical protein